MNKLKKMSDFPPLDDNLIKERSISLSKLWMIKDEQDHVYGPFDTESLKDYTEKYVYLFINTTTYNLAQEQWFDTLSLPCFENNEKNLVSSHNLIVTNDFYILINSQQNGPYTKDEVQAFLNNGNISQETPLSLNKGDSWIKLYEHHAFDRRQSRTNQELPFRPASDVLSKMVTSKSDILEAKEKEEAIVELAFLGHRHTKEDEKLTTQKREEHAEGELFESLSRYMIPIAGVLTICILAFATLHFSKSMNSSESEFKKAARTQKKSINNSPRQVQRKPAQKTRRVPRKIIKKSPRRIAQKRYRATPQTAPIHSPSPAARHDGSRGFGARSKGRSESIDVNDPLIQEEMTRQLSSDYDLDGTKKQAFDGEDEGDSDGAYNQHGEDEDRARREESHQYGY